MRPPERYQRRTGGRLAATLRGVGCYREWGGHRCLPRGGVVRCAVAVPRVLGSRPGLFRETRAAGSATPPSCQGFLDSGQSPGERARSRPRYVRFLPCGSIVCGRCVVYGGRCCFHRPRAEHRDSHQPGPHRRGDRCTSRCRRGPHRAGARRLSTTPPRRNPSTSRAITSELALPLGFGEAVGDGCGLVGVAAVRLGPVVEHHPR